MRTFERTNPSLLSMLIGRLPGHVKWKMLYERERGPDGLPTELPEGPTEISYEPPLVHDSVPTSDKLSRLRSLMNNEVPLLPYSGEEVLANLLTI